MQNSFTVFLGSDPLPLLVESALGLGVAEGWGRWNSDGRVALRFRDELPYEFEAQFGCAAASANIGRAITVLAGSCRRRLVIANTLARGLSVEKVRFRLTEPVRTLELLIPDADVEGPRDARHLGIALSHVSIVPLASDPAVMRDGRAHG